MKKQYRCLRVCLNHMTSHLQYYFPDQFGNKGTLMKFCKHLVKYIFVLSLLLLSSVFVFSNSTINLKMELIDIEAKLLFTLGESDDENEAFYRPMDIAISKKGEIFVLDSGNSRIQCFSSKGEFLYSFGRQGQGPGELSHYAATINILNDENLYLIDNGQKRISIFSTAGDFIKSFKTQYAYDDIVLSNDTYFISGFKLLEDHKPIFFSKELNDIKKSFGYIFDPAINLFKQSKISQIPLTGMFNNSKMSSIAIDSDGNIYYSQKEPYKIIKYNHKHEKILEFNRPVEFDTRFPLEVKYKDGNLNQTLSGPAAIVSEIRIIKNRIIEIIFSPDRSQNYVDIYDLDGNILYCCKLSISLYGKDKGTSVPAAEIDDNFNLYCLYYTREDPPLFQKYSLSLPIK